MSTLVISIILFIVVIVDTLFLIKNLKEEAFYYKNEKTDTDIDIRNKHVLITSVVIMAVLIASIIFQLLDVFI